MRANSEDTLRDRAAFYYKRFTDVVYQYLLTSAGNGVAGPVSAMMLSISIIKAFIYMYKSFHLRVKL